ncbi:DUF7341 domain-containing protein [Gryllotalpicola koreensis]|uniref:Uncharacterized protein n=1 Tax=Gryllotalpicola koreensis TaxID=993086 RepID=A0ABP8A2U3_9MICO
MRTVTASFADLVDQLTQDHLVIVHTDQGIKTTTEGPLLHQLREAIFGGMESGGGSAAFGSRPPIDTAAVDLLERITDEAAQVLAQVSKRPTPYGHAEDYVTQWAVRAREDVLYEIQTREPVEKPKPGQPTFFYARHEYSALTLVERWANAVRSYLNPTAREVPIKAPCPACGVEYLDKHDAGELIQSRALVFMRDKQTETTTGARCNACGATWDSSQFRMLGEAIAAGERKAREAAMASAVVEQDSAR